MQHIETIIAAAIVVALMVAPGCKTTTDLHMHSQNEQFGNQSIELHRTLDTNGTAQ